jgi:hypothetical protein
MHWSQFTLLITPKGLYIKIPHLSQQTNTKFSTFGIRVINWLRMLSCQLIGSREPHTHTSWLPKASCTWMSKTCHVCPKLQGLPSGLFLATSPLDHSLSMVCYFWQLLPLIIPMCIPIWRAFLIFYLNLDFKTIFIKIYSLKCNTYGTPKVLKTLILALEVLVIS